MWYEEKSGILFLGYRFCVKIKSNSKDTFI